MCLCRNSVEKVKILLPLCLLRDVRPLYWITDINCHGRRLPVYRTCYSIKTAGGCRKAKINDFGKLDGVI